MPGVQRLRLEAGAKAVRVAAVAPRVSRATTDRRRLPIRQWAVSGEIQAGVAQFGLFPAMTTREPAARGALFFASFHPLASGAAVVQRAVRRLNCTRGALAVSDYHKNLSSDYCEIIRRRIGGAGKLFLPRSAVNLIIFFVFGPQIFAQQGSR